MITIASPIIEDEEIAAVNKVMESGMLAQGPRVAELEEGFAKYCGTKYAVAVNSGTAALHAALYAAGVGIGDEVITVPFSFIATVNPIILLGAKPVLVDIDLDSFNIDVSQIEKAITDKTKAIMPVHLYGQPANMDEINALAKKYSLAVIEDSAQAIGATYKGTKTGMLGDMGCFSLYATKNIMCGEGGVVTTNSEKLYDLMRQFRQHGMASTYEYKGIGYNFRMTDIQAAIAYEQLKKVDRFNEARARNATYLYERLAKNEKIILPEVLEGRTHAYHQFTIRIKNSNKRKQIVESLKDKDIIVGVYYPQPLHEIPHIAAYGYSVGQFPNSEMAASSVISLPIHPKLTQKDMEYIADSLEAVL